MRLRMIAPAATDTLRRLASEGRLELVERPYAPGDAAGHAVVFVADRRGRRMATLLSNLPGMAYRHRATPGWRMEFVSEGAFDLTGYVPDDLAGDGDFSTGRAARGGALYETAFPTFNEPFIRPSPSSDARVLMD